MMLSNKISGSTTILAVIILFISCTKTEPSAIQKDSFSKSFSGGYNDIAIDIIKDNSNYYVLGNIQDEDDNYTIFLTKTNEFGNRVWSHDKTFSPDGKQTKAGQIIKLQHQEGFAIIGAIEMDIDSLYFDTYIIIIDENGEVLAENIFNNPGYNDYGTCIGELENGGFTIASSSIQAPGSARAINLITASSTGEFIQYSSPFSDSEPFQICKKNSNNGFYISAYNTVANYPFIIIIDALGARSGVQKFGSIAGQIRGIAQDNSGNTFICGPMNNGENGGTDGFIAQLKSVEESVLYNWLNQYGKTKDDNFEHLSITDNNELIVTGSLENATLGTSDIWVVKTDFSGNFLSELIFGGDNNEFAVRVLESDENKVVIEGTTYFENNTMISIFKAEVK